MLLCRRARRVRVPNSHALQRALQLSGSPPKPECGEAAHRRPAVAASRPRSGRLRRTGIQSHLPPLPIGKNAEHTHRSSNLTGSAAPGTHQQKMRRRTPPTCRCRTQSGGNSARQQFTILIQNSPLPPATYGNPLEVPLRKVVRHAATALFRGSAHAPSEPPVTITVGCPRVQTRVAASLPSGAPAVSE